MENFVQLPNQDTIRYILNFVRYDIPILQVGKSSIGKSFTWITLSNQWMIPYEILYVGTEKAENIEGLPKLQSQGDILEYFTPYWFPNGQKITDRIRHGKELFDKFVGSYYSNGKYEHRYAKLMPLFLAIGEAKFDKTETKKGFKFVLNDANKWGFEDNTIILNEKPFELRREIPKLGEQTINVVDELMDFSLFISTFLGFGNFWLILDELDKVDAQDADKYAPMLHIVRERRLKNYSLKQINEGKGIDIGTMVEMGKYDSVYKILDDTYNNNQSFLDTRIIAIANQTTNIEEISDALFRRFIQVVITDVLILKKVPHDLEEIKMCLDQVKVEMEKENIGVSDLAVAFIDDINLQWQLGFLPRLLNKGDMDGNFIRSDYYSKMQKVFTIKNEEEKKIAKDTIKPTTALYKMIRENFNEEKLVDSIFDCLSSYIDFSITGKKDESAKTPIDIINSLKAEGFDDKQTAREIYNMMIQKYEAVTDLIENRSFELEELLKYSFRFISMTAYEDGKLPADNEDKEYTPLPINKYLIPIVMKFSLKVISKDTIISLDDRKRLMEAYTELWRNFLNEKYLDKISGDPEMTKEFFYGGDDSLWGSEDLDADAFQPSFLNKLNSYNIEHLKEFIEYYYEQDEAKQKTLQGAIDFIVKYRQKDLKAISEEYLMLIKQLQKTGDVTKALAESKKNNRVKKLIN